jgi:sterol O-acyltransferase
MKDRKSRPSMLSYEVICQPNNMFRGWFVLFWVTVAASVLHQSYINLKHGSWISLRLALIMSADITHLFWSDMFMVLSMFWAIGFVRMLPNNPRQCLLLHLSFQLAWFAFWIAFAICQQWKWIQQASFTLHVISMLMKQHSYISYNIELWFKNLKYHAALVKSKKDGTPLDPDVLALQNELVKPTISFPHNQTLLNYIDFILIPTFVYELEYPRKQSFSLWFFLDRVLCTLVTAALMYFVVEHWVHPVLLDIDQIGFIEAVVSLAIPFMALWLLLFFVIFEVIYSHKVHLQRFCRVNIICR